MAYIQMAYIHMAVIGQYTAAECVQRTHSSEATDMYTYIHIYNVHYRTQYRSNCYKYM